MCLNVPPFDHKNSMLRALACHMQCDTWLISSCWWHLIGFLYIVQCTCYTHAHTHASMHECTLIHTHTQVACFPTGLMDQRYTPVPWQYVQWKLYIYSLNHEIHTAYPLCNFGFLSQLQKTIAVILWFIYQCWIDLVKLRTHRFTKLVLKPAILQVGPSLMLWPCSDVSDYQTCLFCGLTFTDNYRNEEYIYTWWFSLYHCDI